MNIFYFEGENSIKTELDDGLEYRRLFFTRACSADHRRNINMFKVNMHCRAVTRSQVSKKDGLFMMGCFISLFRLHFYRAVIRKPKCRSLYWHIVIVPQVCKNFIKCIRSSSGEIYNLFQVEIRFKSLNV